MDYCPYKDKIKNSKPKPVLIELSTNHSCPLTFLPNYM